MLQVGGELGRREMTAGGDDRIEVLTTRWALVLAVNAS